MYFRTEAFTGLVRTCREEKEQKSGSEQQRRTSWRWIQRVGWIQWEEEEAWNSRNDGSFCLKPGVRVMPLAVRECIRSMRWWNPQSMRACACVCVCTWACCVLLDEGRGLETIGPKMSSSSRIGAAPPKPSGASDREKKKLIFFFYIDVSYFHSAWCHLCTMDSFTLY